MKIGGTITLAFAGLFAGASVSMSAELGDLCTDIRGKAPDASGRFDAVTACIGRLAQELDRRPEVIPAGAIVAFATECPRPEWEEYKEGWGRFIIGAVPPERLKEIPGGFFRDQDGADLAARPLGQPGGAQTHTLTVEELPSHGHRISSDKNLQDLHNGLAGFSHPENQDYGILATFKDIPSKPGWATVLPDVLEKTGGGDAHPIIPPYIALNLCKKL